MTLVEKMLAAKGAKPAPEAKPVRLPLDGKVAVTKPATEPLVVKALCGHDVLVEKLHPQHGKSQIANIESKKCKACRQADHQQLLARQSAQAAANPKKKKKGSSKPIIERLPDASTFFMSYSAAETLWTGVLKVPDMEPIELQNKAVFKLLQKLDSEYRRRVAEMDVSKQGES